MISKRLEKTDTELDTYIQFVVRKFYSNRLDYICTSKLNALSLENLSTYSLFGKVPHSPLAEKLMLIMNFYNVWD